MKKNIQVILMVLFFQAPINSYSAVEGLAVTEVYSALNEVSSEIEGAAIWQLDFRNYVVDGESLEKKFRVAFTPMLEINSVCSSESVDFELNNSSDEWGVLNRKKYFAVSSNGQECSALDLESQYHVINGNILAEEFQKIMSELLLYIQRGVARDLEIISTENIMSISSLAQGEEVEVSFFKSGCQLIVDFEFLDDGNVSMGAPSIEDIECVRL